ncbi:ISAs1 family transposase [Vibrio parahaemolyticus]|nr:ISAs1 family transposase [Vibrio parahaemolyticus]
MPPLVMPLCAVASGADTWTDIVTWANANEDWIAQHVDMTEGVPSYSTIRRLFTLIKPSTFQALLHGVVECHHPNKIEDHIAIDGKTLRGSRESLRGSTTRTVKTGAIRGSQVGLSVLRNYRYRSRLKCRS